MEWRKVIMWNIAGTLRGLSVDLHLISDKDMYHFVENSK